MIRIKIYLLLLLIATSIFGCIDPYSPPEITAERDYLVIDGFYLVDEVSVVELTTTQNLNADQEAAGITGATVKLEVKDDDNYFFDEIGEGRYELQPVDVTVKKEVRLVIDYQGKQYQSDYVPVLDTPEIDSLSFEAENDGVQFYVSTSDPENDTWYYRWKFVDTWQFTSAFRSLFEYKNGAIVQRFDDIYTCWNSSNSTEIFISTSTNLSQDVIACFPLHKVPANSQRIRLKYSLQVIQQAITQEAYNYYRELKGNTESLGTLFDPQPFQLNGNFQQVGNPIEPVIGYFYAAKPSKKRIFVTSADHPYNLRNNLLSACNLDTVLLSDALEEAQKKYVIDEYWSEASFQLLGYFMASGRCTDCTLRGTNVEPEFWED